MGKWDAASIIINDVRANFNWLNQMFREFNLENSYDDLEHVVKVLKAQATPSQFTFLTLAFRDWAPLAYWNFDKQVYTMHPGMTRELNATGIDDKIYGDVLRHLPHPDPLFVFPEGIAVDFPKGDSGRITAIQISGAKVLESGRGMYMSTADPRANGLYITVIAEVHNAQGKVTDWDYAHISIPILDSFTISEVIQQTRDHFTFDELGARDGIPDDRTLTYMRWMVGIALSHLLYVVSRRADVGMPRKSVATQPTKVAVSLPKPGSPIRHQPVGYVIGPELDAHRRQSERETATVSSDGTRTVSPHTRAAHFHTVRYGKGRANSYVDWFGPIRVKKHEGAVDKPTLHGYGRQHA